MCIAVLANKFYTGLTCHYQFSGSQTIVTSGYKVERAQNHRAANKCKSTSNSIAWHSSIIILWRSMIHFVKHSLRLDRLTISCAFSAESLYLQHVVFGGTGEVVAYLRLQCRFGLPCFMFSSLVLACCFH